MTHRERFLALFSGKPIDRLPLYYFGTWAETKVRWRAEGFSTDMDMNIDAGPQFPEMDPDWETGMWGCHGLVHCGPFGDVEPAILEENSGYIVRRDSIGQVVHENRKGSSVPHVLQYALEPTRESWKNFSRWLDPSDKRVRPIGWENKADELNKSNDVLAFMGGSLYGWLRNWMGVENISYLQYDDPGLFEEMVSFMTDYFMELMLPILKHVKFDFAYIFEDCCGANGPLFSPNVYRSYMHAHYRRLLDFYRSNGVVLTLLDSDGQTDALVPCWLESGVDILFPLEVGKWGQSAARLRSKFGNDIKAIGGVDKHVIPRGEKAIRTHLLSMQPEVERGGFLPMPDHRIPPDCSLDDFYTYIRVFKEVFN